MRKTATSFFSFAFLLFAAAPDLSAQGGLFCDTTSNICIYSNYDGGTLTINVDQNIPNLKIGIVSYEYSVINITGTYAGNVTKVWYAGYDGGNNPCNLNPPYTTSISGVPNSVDTITLYPPATVSDPNGYTSIICGYSCGTGNQGGCNTAQQIAGFFMNKFGGNNIRFHQTNYNCWPSTAVNISAGGNCCQLPLGTSVTERPGLYEVKHYPNPADESLTIELSSPFAAETRAVITDALGRDVQISTISLQAGPNKFSLNTGSLAAGMYVLKLSGEGQTVYRKIQVN
ncbi:MAG: hypothetical protein FD123_63 [Bacteroidetes bacterium]|nr:MAG: hypothetical protein FD123_63 [Bacteroidota bacterium]